MRCKNPVIAVAPIRYYDIYKTHNVEKIKEYIKRAKRAKAEIVCFPESCIKRVGSVPLESNLIKQIREECRKNKIWCIINENIVIKGRPYNAAILIDREGKIKGNYNKINLYGEDHVYAGKKVKVFKTDFGKIGIAICWDIIHSEMFKEMRKKGAEIVFCPAEWNYDEPLHKGKHKFWDKKLLKAMVLARAYENVFYFALCNPIMDEKTQVSYSAIASPSRIIKELVDKEGIITARADLGKLKKIRRLYSK